MRLVVGGVPQGVKRLHLQRFRQVWRRAGNTLNGIDFGGALTALIRDDPVLGLGMTDPNRLGDLLEQVDNRCASQTKSRRANRLLEPGWPVQIEQHIDPIP